MTKYQLETQRLHKSWYRSFITISITTASVLVLSLFISRKYYEHTTNMLVAQSQSVGLLEAISDLDLASRRVNAPGNNVFQTKDLKLERHNLALADHNFLENWQKLKSLLHTNDKKLSPRHQGLLETLRKQHNQVVQLTQAIFSNIEQHHFATATRRMAQMDQKTSALSESLSQVRSFVLEEQQLRFSNDHAEVHTLHFLEKLLLIGTLALLFSLGLYARRLMQFIKVKMTEDEATIQRLDKTNAKLHKQNQIIDAAQEGLIELSPEGTIHSTNEQFANALGLSPLAIASTSIFVYIHPDSHENFEALLKTDSTKHNFKAAQEIRFIGHDGSAVWLRVVSRCLYDNNTINSLVMMCTDVTQQKKRQEELNGAKNQLAAILENSPAAVYECLMNDKWTMLYISPHVETISGYSSTDFIGDAVRSYESIIHPDDRTNVSKAILDAVAQGKAFDLKYRIINARGEVRWVWERGSRAANQGNLIGLIFDITEQRSIQEQLQQRTEELDQFFSVSLDFLGIASLTGIFTKVNPAFITHLGYSTEELTSKPFIDFVHPEDREATLQEVSKLASGQPTLEFENRYRCRDGTYKRLSWVAAPDVARGLLYCAARDITEEYLHKRELEQTMDAINRSAIVAITDTQGKITHVNDAFCSVSGYSRDELIGQDHRLVNSKAHPKNFFRAMWSTISQGKTWSGEIQNRRKDGAPYYVNTVISPVFDIHNRVNRYLAIRFDITAHKEAERALEQAQRMAKIGSWSYHVATHKIYWSKEMFNLFDEDITKGPPSFERHYATIHPEDQQLWKSKVENCLEHKQPYKIRFRSLFPDKSFKWVEAYGAADLDSNGNLVSLSGTCQDVTSLVTAEQDAYEQRVKAAHAAKLASLGEMSAGIAHEINNPLAIIAGTVPLLQKFKDQPEKFEAKLKQLTSSTDRISKIVRGLRKFARTELPSKEYSGHRLSTIVNECLSMVDAKAKLHGTTISVVADETAKDAQILCDQNEIEQVIINLANNAIDATKTLDQRWLRAELSVHYNNSNNPRLVLRMIDSGSGISKEIQEKLFQPFFTTKPVGEGTGLGLSICRGILEQHDATLTIDNDCQNTCFEMVFPLFINNGQYKGAQKNAA